VTSIIKKIYSLVYGNYTDGVQSLLKANDDLEKETNTFATKWILKMTKTIISSIDTKTNLRISLHASTMLFLNIKQQQKEANDTYLKHFKSNFETL